MTQWFSSDPHFGHANIIKFCDRPFSSTKEMDEFIISEHNGLVKPEDHWTCLGDLTMERGGRENQEVFISLIKRLNGHKRLILGNHDHFPIQTYLEAGFEKIYATHMINGMRFTHIPIHPGSMGTARACAHGHIHNVDSPPPVIVEYKDKRLVKPYINLCVEKTGYRPISLDEVEALVDKAKVNVYQENGTSPR